MTKKLLIAAGVAALLAGGYLAALDTAKTVSLFSDREASARGAMGPQIVLQGVEMLEIRGEEAMYRLDSDTASYSVADGRISASGVTLTFRERSGDIVVRASAAAWRMEAGRIDLDEVVSVANKTGWTASAPSATVDLRSQVIVAQEAKLSAPGLTVAGNNLQWRWSEGRMTLDSPKSSVLPRLVSPPVRQG